MIKPTYVKNGKRAKNFFTQLVWF